MSTDSENEPAHIPDERLLEIARSTAEDLSSDERTHLAACDRCARVLGALFRAHLGNKP